MRFAGSAHPYGPELLFEVFGNCDCSHHCTFSMTTSSNRIPFHTLQPELKPQATEMSFPVAVGAQGDSVFDGIIAALGERSFVMDFEIG
jgi:hypothetical protein